MWLSRLRLSTIIVIYYTFSLMWIVRKFDRINVNYAPTNSYFPAIACMNHALEHQMIYGNRMIYYILQLYQVINKKVS